MNKKDFLRKISENCNYIDEKSIEDMYYALLRVFGRELRDKKKITLPDWGEFYLHRHKPRMALNINSKHFESLGAKTTVKFTPNYKMKQHFYDVSVF